MDMHMHKVFVYGTLRINQGNYFNFLHEREGVKYLGKSTISGYKMASLGEFPAIFSGGNEDLIFGDVFEVDDKVLEDLDYLEPKSCMRLRDRK